MLMQMASNVRTKFTIWAIALFTVLAVGFTVNTAYAALCDRSDCNCYGLADPSNATGPCNHYYSNGKLRCSTKGHIVVDMR